MKIDNTSKISSGFTVHTNRTQTAHAADPESPVGATVKISALSSTLGKAEEGLGVQTHIDQSRIHQLKEAIRNGEFKINADKVADSLLSSVQDMLTHRN